MATIPIHPSPESLNWYAIQTRYRFERKVAVHLNSKGIETFLPLLRESHRWSDRRKIIQAPLFSGYVFLRLESFSIRSRILKTEGVIGFVGLHGEALPIPHKQIDDLKRLLSERVPCSLHAFLKVGRRVRIRGGCLDGLEGILAESGHKRLVISIESIQRAIAICIEGYELEPA